MGMTRERIEDFREIVLPFVKKRLLEINYENLGESDAEMFAKDFDEILNLAIKALEQTNCSEIPNNCGDAISRQAVLDAMRNNYRDGSRDIDGDYVEGIYSKKLYDVIISLPSVNPQSKTGRWEKTTDGYCYWYKCSCCGTKALKNEWGSDYFDYFSPYCPECGARMEKMVEE